jgi:hypothetical protein
MLSLDHLLMRTWQRYADGGSEYLLGTAFMDELESSAPVAFQSVNDHGLDCSNLSSIPQEVADHVHEIQEQA